MLEETVKVANRLGLHARAAAAIVNLARTFTSSIVLHRNNGEYADARSILDILAIAAGHGVEIRIVADGPDEVTAVEQIAGLFRGKFGED